MYSLGLNCQASDVVITKGLHTMHGGLKKGLRDQLLDNQTLLIQKS